MSKIKLTYFDFSGSRGEECRLALHVAGVPFEDERISRAAWAAKKATTPYGSMPLLEIEGEGILAQSNAILDLIGTRYGLLPAGDFEAARHRALLCAAEEMRMRLSATIEIKDEDQRKAVREELAAGRLRDWGANIEKQIRGPFVGGEQLSVADIKLFVVAGWIKKGILDHIPATALDDFPKLTKLYQTVHDHPRVRDWYAKRGE